MGRQNCQNLVGITRKFAMTDFRYKPNECLQIVNFVLFVI